MFGKQTFKTWTHGGHFIFKSQHFLELWYKILEQSCLADGLIKILPASTWNLKIKMIWGWLASIYLRLLVCWDMTKLTYSSTAWNCLPPYSSFPGELDPAKINPSCIKLVLSKHLIHWEEKSLTQQTVNVSVVDAVAVWNLFKACGIDWKRNMWGFGAEGCENPRMV